MAASTTPVSNGNPAVRFRRRSRRAIVLCVLASLALHVVLLGVLPGYNVEERLPDARVLDVVLVEPPPPPDVPSEPVPPPPSQVAPEPSAPEPERRVEPRARAPKRSVPQPKSERDPRVPAPSGVEQGVRKPQPAEERSAPPHAPDETPRDFAEPSPAVPATAPQVSETRPPAVAEMTAPAFNASYLRNPAPRYPLIARRNGEQGTVTLRVLVARDGMPSRVTVERTSGSRHLDSAALETVKTWRFVPARKGGEAIEAWVLVPIVFRLEGAS